MDAAMPDGGLAEIIDKASGHIPLTVRELAAWLEGRLEDVKRLAVLLANVAKLVADGRDVRVEDLPLRLRLLGELGKLRTQLISVSARVWPAQAPPQGADEKDWSALRDGANALLGLLNRWRGPLPPPVVRALTSPDIRARLKQAVSQTDSTCGGAFQESWRFLGKALPLKPAFWAGFRASERLA
jgi:hypothetical protein